MYDDDKKLFGLNALKIVVRSLVDTLETDTSPSVPMQFN